MSGRRSAARADNPPGFNILDELEDNQFAAWVVAKPALEPPHLDVDAPFPFAEAHAPSGIPPWHPLEPAKRLRANKPLPAADHKGHGLPLSVEANIGGLHNRAILALRRPAEPMDVDELFAQAHVIKDFRRVWLVSLFLGFFGVDRFITGRYVTGALKLLTLGGAGLWWAADLFTLASGSAVDGGGHPFGGKKSHRIAAFAVSVLAVGALTAIVPPQVAPYAESLKREAIRTVTLPAPAPEWKTALEGAEGTGNATTAEITVTGTKTRLLAEADGMAFFYLHPAGNSIEGTKPVISLQKAGTQNLILDVEPGTYTVSVLSPTATWKIAVEDLAPR